MNYWSKTSKRRLLTCHREIIRFAEEVLQVHDCSVITGYRNSVEQNKLYYATPRRSKLKYPNSKHNINPSIAIDLVPYVPQLGGPTWDNEYSLYFAGLALGVADMLFKNGQMSYKIRCGLNWSTNRQKNFKLNEFRDTLHFELYRS
jgi:peptidoglycan L-alanyl-D-glutamate endopeptidase CwlK